MKTEARKAINEIVFSRYIEKIYPTRGELQNLLKSGKRLTIYIGIDPTAPQLHLGHSTNFLLIKKFQKLGHKVILLIGDFTAQIGDPTGKLETRRLLTKKEVLKNCQSYKEQAGKILDFRSKENPVELKFNSQWLSKLNLEKVIKLMAKATVGQMIKREMFQKRIEQKKEIYLHEFLYPLLQGYDSVAMNVDIEVGGNDQTFNMMVGRDLVKEYLGKEKVVIATKLLINPKTKRKLMSKSEGFFIALDDKPDQMYGKIMALPDVVILPIFELCTEIDNQKIKEIRERLKRKEINPKEVKSELAREIVKIYHGEKVAKEAEEEFERVFKEKKLPLKIPGIKIKEKELNIVELLLRTKQVSSKSEAKRLILQKAVKINGVLKKDWREKIKIGKGMVIKVGKRRFVKLNPPP